ncbi:Hsp20/alpha crystallin family protein [Candidatus Saccharibacteria bacterium]|nr:Hsp20/alpha crystallin family protein [Candidatus Saccharibacteria bacterium]
MARKTNEDMLMEDELAAAFLEDDATTMLEPDEPMLSEPEEEETLAEPEEEEQVEPSDEGDDGWETGDDFPGQLAVDVYETADKLVIKARTAGIKKSDLNVSIHDSILTISGVLSGGEDDQTTRWHIQECYWGEFSRTIALPVQVREDENSVKAELRDGVLTITFDKEKVEAPKVIPIQ